MEKRPFPVLVIGIRVFEILINKRKVSIKESLFLHNNQIILYRGELMV